jgi:hypothetical protein
MKKSMGPRQLFSIPRFHALWSALLTGAFADGISLVVLASLLSGEWNVMSWWLVLGLVLFLLPLPLAGRVLIFFFRGGEFTEAVILASFSRAGAVLLLAWGRTIPQLLAVALLIGLLASLSLVGIARSYRLMIPGGGGRAAVFLQWWTGVLGWGGGLVAGASLLAVLDPEIVFYIASGILILTGLLASGAGDLKPLARSKPEV